MDRITASNECIEFSNHMHIGFRVFLFIAGLGPCYAPYDLLIKPHWKEFNLVTLFALFISLGAMTVSLRLIGGALFGLNQILRFDANTRTVLYAYESLIMQLREKRYSFRDVSSIEIFTHQWDSRADSFGLEIAFCDKLKVRMGDIRDKCDANHYRETLLNWVQNKDKMGIDLFSDISTRKYDWPKPVNSNCVKHNKMKNARKHPTHLKITSYVGGLLLLLTILSFGIGFYLQGGHRELSCKFALSFLINAVLLVSWLFFRMKLCKCPYCGKWLSAQVSADKHEPRKFICLKCNIIWDTGYIMYFESADPD